MKIEFCKQIYRARRKTLLALLALLLINAALYLYAVSYQDPHLAGLHRKEAEKRQMYSGGVTRDAAAIYSQGKADLGVWNARIAPKKDFARFVGSLFELAADNSLKVGGVTYKPVPVKEENLIAFSIAFNVTGKYAAVKSFIADIARMREIMYIDSIALNNSKPTEEAVDMKLQLTAYFRMEGT